MPPTRKTRTAFVYLWPWRATGASLLLDEEPDHEWKIFREHGWLIASVAAVCNVTFRKKQGIANMSSAPLAETYRPQRSCGCGPSVRHRRDLLLDGECDHQWEFSLGHGWPIGRASLDAAFRCLRPWCVTPRLVFFWKKKLTNATINANARWSMSSPLGEAYQA